VKFPNLKNLFAPKLVENKVGNIYGVLDGQSKYGLSDTKGDKSAMLKAYKSWVYACVSARAQSVASAVFRVYRRNGADDYTELDDHPSIRLMDNPNPLDTRYDLLFKIVAYMDLTGDAYVAISKDGAGRQRELWVLPSDKVTIVPSLDGVIKSYELRPYGANRGQVITYTPEEIIHFKHPNVNNFYYGSSILQASDIVVDINEFQHDYQRTFYKNSALPPAVLETDSKLDESVFKRLRQMIQSVYGGGENSGKTMILENGLKLKPFSFNPKDLDWMATNSAAMREICAVFKVPPSMLGIVEDVNRANAESQEYTYSKMAIEPLLRNIDERLTTGLLKNYLDGSNLFIKHDSTVPKNVSVEAQASRERIFSGKTTINEERKLDGYDGIGAQGDIHFMPTNYMPLEQMIKREVTQEGKPVQEKQQTIPEANNE